MSLYQSISETLSSNNWLSTQETAYALIAAAPVLQNAGTASLSVDYVFKGTPGSIEFKTPVQVLDLGPADGLGDSAAVIRFTNRSTAPVYIRASVKGTPREGMEPEMSQGLALTIEYRDMDGRDINPDTLNPGDDMEIRVTLRNTSPDRAVQELALVHLLPADYEIVNTRLGGAGDSSSLFKYQDIRDDRVMTYFDLARGASKTVSFTVNRVYAGSFFRPAIRAYAMYDESICAVIPGRR
jgi:uncharacterized protein YfaS (alpha-2-macroglobulin family)